MFKCAMEHDEVDEEYTGFYTQGKMMINPIYGQISYNCYFLNAFKLKVNTI